MNQNEIAIKLYEASIKSKDLETNLKLSEIEVAKLRAQNKMMYDTLKKIAGMDFRGNRPIESLYAERALKEMGEIYGK